MNYDSYRTVYVISYDSLYNAGQRVYLRTSPKRTGVSDIQKARRFSSLTTARNELTKIKKGNPRIEQHLAGVIQNHSAFIDPTALESIEP